MAPEFGSDVIVDLMRAHGIEYAAFNPGATFRGIHDSLVNYQPEKGPRIIQVAHEEISVAIAQGYAKAALKPMAALVHNIVGLQHASMAIFNAWVDRVPVIVMGGTGPKDITIRRPWIDWIHTALVQGNQIHDYVKYDDEPASLASVPDSFIRAYRLATQEPQGPVYLNYDIAIQEEKVPADFRLPDISRYPAPTRLAPDPEALSRLVRMLVEAENPLVIADYSGRNPSTVPVLVELAELLGLAVWDKEHRMSFPNTHPLDISGAEDEYLQKADLVLALDNEDLFGSLNRFNRMTGELRSRIRPECKVVHISLRELGTHAWANDFQRVPEVTMHIVGDTSLALPAMLAEAKELLKSGSRKDIIEKRKQEIAVRHQALREEWQRFAEESTKESGSIHPAYMAKVLNDVLRGEEWEVAQGDLGGWARRMMDWEKPNCWQGRSGGGGLGYGLGATIGASLAHRGKKIVVGLQADGDFLFTPSALWTAAHYQIPGLVVMDNNRTYYNSQHHAEEVAIARNRPVENQGVGTEIKGPDVDFIGLARAFECEGIGPVDDPRQLESALREGVRKVKEGRFVVVDVRTRHLTGYNSK